MLTTCSATGREPLDEEPESRSAAAVLVCRQSRRDAAAGVQQESG
jgi:hypothetical protein